MLSRRAALRGGTAVALGTAAGVVVAAPLAATPDDGDRRREAWLGLENRLAEETPANTLKGVHAKLQASNRGKGYRFNDDLALSAAADLARLVREG